MHDGMFVALAAVHDGSHPEMPIVDALTADGSVAQFEVSRCSIVGGRYGIGWPVGYRASNGAPLIEFSTQYGCLSGGPNFGCHRVWVLWDSLVRGDEMGEGRSDA